MSRKHITALVGAIALMLAYSLTTTGLGFFIAPVTREFGYDRAAFSLHFTIMTCISTATALFIGPIIQQIGIRRMLLLGGLLCSGCFLAFSFCNSLLAFYIVAGVMGLMCTACTNITAVILVNLWFPERNGVYMGIVTAGTGLGGGIMSIILPPFLALLGWRAGYVLLAVIWFALLALAALFSGGNPEEDKNESPSEGKPAQQTIQEGATCKQLIRSKSFYCFMLGVFLLFWGSTFAQHMPAYFEETGASAILSGIIVGVFNFSFMIFKILEGILFDRMGPRRFIATISVTYGLGFWILRSHHLLWLFGGSAFLATGIALVAVMPPLMTAKLFGRREFPTIWGVVSLTNTMGKAVGAPAWGAVFDHFGSYKPGLAVFPFLILVAGVFVLFAVRLNRGDTWNANKP